MAADRGVFPGQWALPGSGVEPGERIEDALRREAREELGVDLVECHPLFFKDAVLPKTWFAAADLGGLALNELTRATLTQAGF